jgi:hypothetical protein
VSEKVPHLELFRRGKDGQWVWQEAHAGATLALAFLGVELPVDDVYRNPIGWGRARVVEGP